MPVLEAILLGVQERLRRIAVLVEMLGEAAFAAGEVDEVYFFIRLGVLVPIILHGRIALQRQALFDFFAFARIVNHDRERPAIDGQASLFAGHVVGDAVLGLAGGVANDDG